MQLSQPQIDLYREQGYLFFPELFSSEEVDVVRRAVPDLLSHEGPEVLREESDKRSVRMVFGAHFFQETFRRLARHPRLLSPTEQLLGSGVHVFQSRFNPKMGFTGNGWGWHQDFNQWHRFDGMKKPRGLLTGVFIDDINACNAPLMLIPGSQKRGHVPVPDRMEIDLDTIRDMAEEGGIEPIIGPPGSVLFLDCTTVHGSTPNISPWSRWIHYFLYNSVENQEIDGHREIHLCDTDFTPLEALPDDCLVVPAS